MPMQQNVPIAIAITRQFVFRLEGHLMSRKYDNYACFPISRDH